MLNLIQKNCIRIIFLISFVALISAYFIEYVLGHQPCNLCLLERIPYAVALVIVIFNYKLNHLEKYFILLPLLLFAGLNRETSILIEII